MERRNTAGGLVGAATLLMLAAGATQTNARTEPQERARTEQAASSGTDFFMKPDIERARSGARLLQEHLQGDATQAAKERLQVDFMVALIPDPLDSHLDYEFDAELAALRQAYEASGFIIDRFWLPWSVDREKSELAAKGNRIDTTAYRRRSPGVIVFRHISRPQVRVLYLVGEIPTSGIAAAAFDTALADRLSVIRDTAHFAYTGIALRIVGPAFTGGAESLARALARAHARGTTDGDERVNIISGSATGPVKAVLELSVPRRVSFHATVHSDLVLDRVERNVLCRQMGIPLRYIAKLRESSTLYGASLQQPLTQGSSSDKCAGHVLEIPFPANISGLRTEYARQPATSGESMLQSHTPSRVPLKLEDPTRAMENPQIMSGLTPAITDVQLDEITRTLDAHRIRVVGIFATDARDKLFLAEQLRRRRRELTLFTTGSSVLLLKEEINPALRGMLVFGTYALQPEVQRWDMLGVGDNRIAFVSDEAEGVFNAARLQLEYKPWLAEYGFPSMNGAPLYCGGSTRVVGNGHDVLPPVWVLSVGRSGYFPVTACPTGNSNDLMVPRLNDIQQGAPRRYGSTHTIIGIVLIVFTILFAVLELKQRRFLREKVPRMRAHACIREIDWRLLVMHAELYGVLRGLAIVILVAGLSIGFAHRLGDELWSSYSIRKAVYISVAIISILILVRAVNGARAVRYVWEKLRSDDDVDPYPCDRREHRSRFWDFVGRIAIFAAGLAYTAVVFLFLRHVLVLTQTSPMRGELFLERSSQLTGGYSPAMALAWSGAMFILWSSWHISRIHMLLTSPSGFESASIEARGAFLARDGRVRLARWGTSMREARAHLMVLAPDNSSVALLILCAILSGALIRIIWPTFESLLFPMYYVRGVTTDTRNGFTVTIFDILARLGVTAALSASAWSVYRTARLWRSLQRTLDEIGRTPQLTAFERLPRRVARLTRLNALRPQAAKLIRSIVMTQWLHMRRLYAGMSPGERAALTANLGPVSTSEGVEMTASNYMDQLMNEKGPGERVWMRDDWMSPKPPLSSRKDESAALRFLFDVTDIAQLDEPSTSDFDRVRERTESMGEAAPHSTSGNIRRTFGGPRRLWVRTAEELIAVNAVDYIYGVMQHLRYLTFYIIGSLAIVTELLWSYELHPASALWLIVIVLVVGAMGVLLSVVVQMNRNEILSRINGTAPGEVTWNWQFVLNLALIAVVPAVTFVGSELPWLRDGLSTWFSPLVKAVGGH